MSHRAIRLPLFSLAIVLIVELLLASQAAAAGRYVVVLHDHASGPAAAKLHGAAPSHVYSHALRGYAATLSTTALANAQRDPAVKFITYDRVITLGKPGSSGKDNAASAQVVPTGIARIGQSQLRRDGNSSNDGPSGVGSLSSGVDVAVIDTGIDAAHTDLNVVSGYNCSTGSSSTDGHGHGTHVAGTIGAIDNNVGVVGVAPGVDLHAVRVLDDTGSGSWSSVTCGIDWVAGNADIEVANLSLGGSGRQDGPCGQTSDLMHIAICGATEREDNPVTVVAAAGNDDRDSSGFIPAAYDEVITVSAWADYNGSASVKTPKRALCYRDVDETMANFSNWGAPVDIAAPGVCIRSTWKDGGYETASGTSMASPHVAGAAALHRALTPGATAESTRSRLLANRSLMGPGEGPEDDGDSIWEGLLSIAGW